MRPHEIVEADAHFRAMWRSIARCGGCDSIDGMEYERVHRQWVNDGRPGPVSNYIRLNATKSAEGGAS